FCHIPPLAKTYILSLHDALPIYCADTVLCLVALGPCCFKLGYSRMKTTPLPRFKHLLDTPRLGLTPHRPARPPLCAYRFAAMNRDRKSTRLNSSHVKSSYAVFCL